MAALEKELSPRDGEGPPERQVRAFDTMRALYPDEPCYSDSARAACVHDAEAMQRVDETWDDHVLRLSRTLSPLDRLTWVAAARHLHVLRQQPELAEGFEVRRSAFGEGLGYGTSWIKRAQ